MRRPWRLYFLLAICLVLTLIRSWYQVQAGRGGAYGVVFCLGILATVLSASLSLMLRKINHPLGKAMALECMADVLSAGCTTIFSGITLFGFDPHLFLQDVLRVLIVGSSVAANLHILWIAFLLYEKERGEK